MKREHGLSPRSLFQSPEGKARAVVSSRQPETLNKRQAQKGTSPALFILTVGRLVWDKAQDVLLEAFALMSDESKEWRLSMVGDGLLKADLPTQAEEPGIAGRVDWHGVVSDPHDFYRAAQVFALPSGLSMSNPL